MGHERPRLDARRVEPAGRRAQAGGRPVRDEPLRRPRAQAHARRPARVRHPRAGADDGRHQARQHDVSRAARSQCDDRRRSAGRSRGVRIVGRGSDGEGARRRQRRRQRINGAGRAPADRVLHRHAEGRVAADADGPAVEAGIRDGGRVGTARTRSRPHVVRAAAAADQELRQRIAVHALLDRLWRAGHAHDGQQRRPERHDLRRLQAAHADGALRPQRDERAVE